MKKNIGILNYGTGNISSLKNAISKMNMTPIYTSSVNRLSKCDVIILPGVSIGEGAVIGAGSVVTKNIEPYTVNAGVPCGFIKIRDVESYENRKMQGKFYQEMAWKKRFAK